MNTTIRAYFAKKSDMDSCVTAMTVYTASCPDFWVSTYRSSNYAMLIVNGDDADHAYIMGHNNIYDSSILDIRYGLQALIDSTKFATVIAAIPELNISDFDNVLTTADFINTIIQALQPGACPLSFDNTPRAAGTFTDDFTGTNGELLQSRTGWILDTDGAYISTIYNNAITFRVGGGGSGPSAWVCTDQGSIDQYIIVYDGDVGGNTLVYAALAYVDVNNFVAYHLVGSGATGARLCKVVSGVVTDSIVATQSAVGYGFKLEYEASTNIARLFRDTGTGFSQVGTDQLIADAIFDTTTRAGFVSDTAVGSFPRFLSFENGVLAVEKIAIKIIGSSFKKIIG